MAMSVISALSPLPNNMGIGLAFFIARGAGGGAGRVVAQTYEYGNAFLIVAGLLNMLVVLDAFDITQGRK